MAWTHPSTAVAATALTAATWNAQVRDNMAALLPLDALAWSTYTPTLTQSGAVTKTVTKARYGQVGKIVVVRVALAVTGAGTANNAITVSLPVTAAGTGEYVGQFVWFNAGVNEWVGSAYISTTTTVKGRTSGAGGIDLGVTGSADGTALANTDLISMSAIYEAA